MILSLKNNDSLVIVTGATGFLGSQLVHTLIAEGWHVVAIVRPGSINTARLMLSPNLQIVELNLDNLSALPKYISYAQSFFHLGWEGIRGSHRNDTDLQATNVQYSISALNCAVALGCECFVGAGSQAEYGETNSLIYEQSPTQPSSAYGEAKLKTYQTLADVAAKQKIRFLWPRIFSLYGTNDYAHSLVMYCLKNMLANKDIALTSCLQQWDFLHVRDAALALLTISSTLRASGLYNVAFGQSRQLKDFVLEMKTITKSKSKLGFGEIEELGINVAGFSPQISKITAETSWSPTIPFNVGFRELIKEHPFL